MSTPTPVALKAVHLLDSALITATEIVFETLRLCLAISYTLEYGGFTYEDIVPFSGNTDTEELLNKIFDIPAGIYPPSE